MTEDDMRKAIKKTCNRLDEDAEAVNAHDFVTTHRALAVLAVETIGVEPTLLLFRALAKERGLPGLTNVCGILPDGKRPLLERKGLSTNWADWALP
jgi:hypothetical protein